MTDDKLIAEFAERFPTYSVIDKDDQRGDITLLTGVDLPIAQGDISHFEDRYGVTPKIIEDPLTYSISWNSLMSIVEKINNLDTLHFIIIEGNRVRWIVEDDESLPIIYQSKSMIKLVYDVVVDFIKWYNKNKL